MCITGLLDSADEIFAPYSHSPPRNVSIACSAPNPWPLLHINALPWLPDHPTSEPPVELDRRRTRDAAHEAHN